MDRSRIENALAAWCSPGRLESVRTMTSAVTTAWGVEWDETFIARDLMQNFFDANRPRPSHVVVKSEGTTVAVTAPAEFSLERLFFLGSEKDEDDIGQFGEGFKAAATCLLRDQRVTPIVASGEQAVCLRVAEKAVAGSRDLFPVEYDFYRCGVPVPGTVLILLDARAKLTAAMQSGLHHFFHEQNPLLGPLRWRHHAGHFAIYDSTEPNGHIFYRKLKRGEIQGIPLVLVIDKEYAAIEKKTRQDRDRKAFGGELMEHCYQVFVQNGVSTAWGDGQEHAQRIIVEASRGFWEKGHPLLSKLARYSLAGFGRTASVVQEVFGERYFVRSREVTNPAERLEIEPIERQWRSEGRIPLPAYFSGFGVPSAEVALRRARMAAECEARERGSRKPTPAEWTGLRVLEAVLREFSPAIAAVFDRGTTSYTVAKTELLLGQLQSGRRYGARTVFLAESVFSDDFSRALAVFLHEHAHIFGFDGSRGFTDALTELLETVVLRRDELDSHEARWTVACEAVFSERSAGKCATESDVIETTLLGLDEAELRALLAQVPRGMLRKLVPAHPASEPAARHGAHAQSG